MILIIIQKLMTKTSLLCSPAVKPLGVILPKPTSILIELRFSRCWTPGKNLPLEVVNAGVDFSESISKIKANLRS